MKTMKLTALFAMTSVACGVAFAQPAETTGTMDQRAGQRAEGRMGNMAANPTAKLRLANSLDSLTPEQKTQIREFMESRKDQFDAFRTEMQSAMQQARQGTDRQARRQAMEPLRQKHETMSQEVETFLNGVLTPEQQQELKQKASEMGQRGRMGRRGDDASTTGSRQGRRDRMNRAAADDATTGTREGRRGRRDGQRQNRQRPAADTPNTPAISDPGTTGTVNPFATTE